MIYKKILLSVFSILPLLSFGQWDTWTQLDDVNGAPKTACVGFELAGEGFIALGLDEMFERKQLYSYDVAADDCMPSVAVVAGIFKINKILLSYKYL